MSHAPYQVMPALSADEYAALKADIAARGVQIAVEYDDRGNILDGHHRVKICEELGIVHWPKQVRQGLSEHEKRHHARRLNLERRHLDREARRSLIAQELRERPQVSDRAIADGLNVDHKTVGSVRDELEAGGEIPHLEEREGADGKTYPTARVEAPTGTPLPHGARSIMSSRQEPDDSLDFFPTPPWATRALIETVFRQVGARGDCRRQSAWDPACGEGHVTEVLSEYFHTVTGTDICNYGSADGRLPPAWSGHLDFIDHEIHVPEHDWIITNPPFREKAEPFLLRALSLARVGVAMLFRLQWLETEGRCERIFIPHPPTMIAFFAERVGIWKGQWVPDGGTATAYIWLVWVKGRQPRAPFWIPPGQREALTRPDDAARFTAHPVIKRESLPPHDPETGEITDGAPQMGAVTQSAPGRCPAAASSISAAKGAGHPSVDSYEIPPWLKRTA